MLLIFYHWKRGDLHLPPEQIEFLESEDSSNTFLLQSTLNIMKRREQKLVVCLCDSCQLVAKLSLHQFLVSSSNYVAMKDELQRKVNYVLLVSKFIDLVAQ